MAFAATRITLLVLLVTFCAIGHGLTARSRARMQGRRAAAAAAVNRSTPRRGWEPPVQLDGSPVDRYSISATKPIRAQHRLAKAGGEDVGADWANLDGFAVVGGAPVNVSSAAGRAARPLSPAAPARVEPPVEVPVLVPVTRVNRRPPQSSSGPRQPYSRSPVRLPLVERRRQHSTKPQSDQRNRNSNKLASESVHVVSLQAQRTPSHRRAPIHRAVVTKAIMPVLDEAKDIAVRVMSPQSVLIYWVDPAVELKKVPANELRYYMVKYREKGESARWEYKGSTQRRLVVDSLLADGMYEFSVRITQGEKHGKWSVSVFQRTPESAPSGPPENFEVKPLRGKGTSVIATWEPPEEPNGRIREYILSYAPAMKPFGMKSITYRSGTTSATIDGLTPGDRYIFKIKAINRRGQGPLSKAFSVAMPGTMPLSSSKKDRGSDESAEVTEAPQTTPASNRRVRPLSQSRSYHSIFSSIRGSFRNGASSRGRAREEEEEEEETSPTTPPPEEEPVTVEDEEEVTEAPQTTPASNRRVRPLSPSRYFHSILSSVRGSVRNGASSRGRAREEEEEEEETSPTTPPPEEEPVTVEDEEEPDNDVVYPEPEVTPTPQATTLEAVTLAPTTTTSATTRRRPPPRRPIKIRVHQRQGSKASSSSSLSSTFLSSSSSSASSSVQIPSHSKDTVIKKDSHTDYLKPESKVTYAQHSITQSKPSTPVQTTAQPKTVAPALGKDLVVAGRTSGSLLNSRYGFGQRNSAIPSRGNFTRNPNGYKYRPASAANPQSNLPGRTQHQASSNTDSSKSQSALPTGSQNREASGTSSSATSRYNSRTGSQSESTSNTDRLDASRSRSHSPSTSSAHNPTFPFTSHSGSWTAATSGTHDSGSARSTPHRAPNTHHQLHTPEKQDTTYREESDDAEHKNTGSKTRQAEEQTSSARFATLNANVQTSDDDRKKTEEREDEQGERTVLSPGRGQPSHDERLPSLASRYPGRFGTGTRVLSNRQEGRAPWGRTSSSLAAGRAVLQGSARRVSGASGAAGVSKIQETSENVEISSVRNPLKNGVRESLLKPSLTVRNNDFSESRQPSTSSAASSSSNSNSHHSSGGHRASNEPIHGGASNNNNNNNNNDNYHGEDYLYEGSKETVDRNEKVPDPTAAPRGTVRESSSGSRTSSSNQRRPAVSANGRVRSPVLAKRQSGGYRLPFRVQPAQNTRASLSKTESSLSESTSSSSASKMPKPVLTSDRGEGRGSSVSRTGGLSGRNSPLTSSSAAASYTPSSSSASSRDSLRTRSRYPNFREIATNGGALKPSYGNGNITHPVHTTQRSHSPRTADLGRLSGRNSPLTSSSAAASYTPSSSSASSRDSLRTRSRYPNFREIATNGGALKPSYGNEKNGRPNLTTSQDKESSTLELDSKARRRLITGPDGKKWVVDLDQGLLMNEEGRALQDSQGRPRRVVLGEDGQTIFDLDGSPLVNQDGLALFGHGRDGRPVVNPKDKILTVGGKLVLGLDRPHHRTTTTTRAPTTTTTRAPTTTTTTTTRAPTTTTEWYPEESTTFLPYPTCPPGTFSKTDEYGDPLLDPEGILDCYPEEESSGMESDYRLTDALALEQEYLLVPTTLQPLPTTTTASTTTTTTTQAPPTQPGLFNRNPSSALDLTGKKRFTAPYLTYIQKDPGAPCSLTEALEYLQVDVLEQLMEKDKANYNQPPQNKPHNITVVAMEGCHSFIILDWARPLKNDMVSGYMVHSASYDDILSNRWSYLESAGTHLAVENLKPNSRYYFKVQAKNVFGLGPVSETLTYVTESDDPLLIERPPGGEPIWIPFSFKYNHAHTGCKGSQFVKRTWYRKFVGVVLCNSLRYKIFMGEGLRETFYSIADTFGQGEDHCQFVDSYLDGRTGPTYLSNYLPAAQGFYRSYRQQPVTFGMIGKRTAHPFVGWYECGVPIPGKW